MNSKFWVALTVGVAAGATIALLYAPQSGSDTRDQIKKGVDDATNYLTSAGDYLRNQADTLTREAQSTFAKARSSVDTALNLANSLSGGAAKTSSNMM